MHVDNLKIIYIDLIFAESTNIVQNNPNCSQQESNQTVDVIDNSKKYNEAEPLHESNKHIKSEYSHQECINGDVSSSVTCNISSYSNDPTDSTSNTESFPSDIELATTIQPQGNIKFHRKAWISDNITKNSIRSVQIPKLTIDQRSSLTK